MRLFTKEGYHRPTSKEEQQLYDHLIKCVRNQSPDEVLENFRNLFIRGREYHDHQVYSALGKIINSKEAELSFGLFFNRCCHIIINHWQMEPKTQLAIPKLVELFEGIPPVRGRPISTSMRLRVLILNYIQSEKYVHLKRLAQVIDQGKKNELVGQLINRYPYLYNHYLIGEDSNKEQLETIKQIQEKTEHNFEIELSKYVAYRMRTGNNTSNPELNKRQGRIIQEVRNPTLLTDRELGTAIKHYAGKVEAGNTYKDLSKSFIIHTTQARSYQAFKDELYEYIITSVDPKYGQHKFNEKLYKKIQSLYPDCNKQKPDEFLMMRTTSQLFNFLIVDSPQRPNHYVFLDMMSNMGPTRTIGLLLKIVLICGKVKPYLEKRFSILFNHYESFTQETVPWLIKSLENLHVALSLNFGKVDLSFLKGKI